MQLNELVLRSFAIHRELRLAFTKSITVIQAENDGGKSTVKDAINFALRGVCAGLDESGGGLDDLVTEGESKASLEVIADTTLGAFARKAGDGPRSAKGAALANQLGVRPEMAALCLEWGTILNAPDKEARAILLRCLGVDVTGAAVRAVIGGADFAYLGTRIVDGDLDSLARAYEYVYAHRRELGRIVKAYKPMDFSAFAEEIRDFSIEDAAATMQEAKDQVAELGEELLSMAQTEGVSTGAKVEIGKQIVGLKARLRVATEDASTAGAMAARRDALATASENALKALRDAETSEKAQVAEASAAGAEAAALLASVTALKRGSGKGTCPMCLRSGLTSGMVDTIAKALLEKAGKKKTEAEACIAAVKALDLPSLRSALKEADTETDRANDAARAGELAEKAAHDFGEEIALLEARLAALPTVQREPGEDGDPDAAVALRARIGKGNAIIGELGRLITAREADARFEAGHVKLKAEHVTCDRLVDALSPAGTVATELIGKKIQPFQEKLNMLLEPMGYQIQIALDPFDIKGAKIGRRFSSARGGGRLCSSAKLRLSAVLQAAVAIHSGLNFFVLDDCDRLDPRSQNQLIDTLYACLEGGVEQIVVCATLGKPRADFEDPGLDNVEFMLLPEVEKMAEVMA